MKYQIGRWRFVDFSSFYPRDGGVFEKPYVMKNKIKRNVFFSFGLGYWELNLVKMRKR